MICQLEEMKGPTNLILNHQATQILFHRSSSPCTRLILNDFGFMYLDVMSPFLQSNARQVANNNMPGLKRNVSLFFSFLLCESNFICSTNFIVLNLNKTAWRLPDDYLTTAWQLPDNCLMTAWWLPNDCLTTTWWLPDDCLTSAWWLPDNCLVTAWNLMFLPITIYSTFQQCYWIVWQVKKGKYC